MAKFQLQARTIVESAELALDGEQLQALAAAAPYLRDARADLLAKSPRIGGYEELGPVEELLDSIESLVSQAGAIAPKRKMTRRANPTNGKSGASA